MAVFAPGVPDIIAVGLYSAFTVMNCIPGHSIYCRRRAPRQDEQHRRRSVNVL